MRNDSLPYGIPEEEGVSSGAILRYISALENAGLAMHSLILIRHGKILAEGYWKPFHAERKHRMYSCSKSFVSLAIGCLAQEGVLSLDDPIVSHFPEMEPENGFHPYIAQTTIRDMLRMASPHAQTAYTLSMRDWITPFFTKTPTHLPGSMFHYDTSASHTLGALVQKLTGQTFLAYLRPRLLDPIGFSEDAYCVADPMGIAWGGSGVVCTPMDFAKVAFCCLRRGDYMGRQLLPAGYIKEATARQIDTYIVGRNIDMRQGYGYQFWRSRNDGFSFVGMGGQIALCLPREDMLLVLNGDDQYQSDQYVTQLGAFWNTIFAEAKDEPIPRDANAEAALRDKLARLEIAPVCGAKDSGVARAVNAVAYQMDASEMHIDEATFRFEGDTGSFSYRKGKESFQIRFGMGAQEAQIFPECGYESIVSAAWADEHTLSICCYIIDDHCATLRISANFSKGQLTLAMRCAAEGFLADYNGVASGRAALGGAK